MALVTAEQAANHLRMPELAASPIDSDLELKLAMAEDIILNYIGDTSPPRWTDENDVPPVVAAAIMLQLGELWRFRGDDVDGEGPAQTDGHLSPTITNLLRRYRDPVIA